MRTKTLLLSAAALVAGLASSVAQSNVYSVNIVGYVNSSIVGNGGYTLLANPLVGPSNTVVGLLDSVLPNKSTVSVWDSASQSFIISTKILGNWNTNVAIPAGAGFFVRTPEGSPALTNTFVGEVVVGQGETNTVALPAAYVLVGSPIPFAGNLTAAGPNSVNLGGVLPNKSTVSIWDSQSQGFIIATKILGNWNTNLNLNVGQGFFINSSAPTNWSQTLQ